MATRITFPGDGMNSEIPVFLTFYWNQYKRFNSGRTSAAVKAGGNYISVPYPKLFNVSNDMKYTDSGTIGGSPLDIMKMKADEAFKSSQFMYNYFQGGNAFTFDNMETVLAPGAKRKYVVSMDLVAKTTGQASQINKIITQFQLNTHSSWNGANKLIWTHPPLWFIDATNSGAGSIPGWSPTTLPSVLTHMDVNRNPILDTPFNLNGYPLAVNINLTFLELEPAVNYNGKLINRAETFKSF